MFSLFYVLLAAGAPLLQSLQALANSNQNSSYTSPSVLAPVIPPNGTCGLAYQICLPDPYGPQADSTLCCPSNYTCGNYGGLAGCCPKGETCIPDRQCTYGGYYLCQAPFNFCCPDNFKCVVNNCAPINSTSYSNSPPISTAKPAKESTTSSLPIATSKCRPRPASSSAVTSKAPAFGSLSLSSTSQSTYTTSCSSSNPQVIQSLPSVNPTSAVIPTTSSLDTSALDYSSIPTASS